MELSLQKPLLSKSNPIEERFYPLLKTIEHTLDRMSSEWLPEGPGQEQLIESLRYSLLSGGKRFRPLLTCIVTQCLNGSVLDVMTWAGVLEFIHAYSLIHDDLPCMDNDDVRRGKPTNHKVYGEAMALLAGDALLTEAFGALARHYPPETAVELIKILSEAAGVRGMVGGQALDISPTKLHGAAFVQTLHEMKTGALIRAACEGAAVVAQASISTREAARELGITLGFAFQLKDDLLDFKSESPEPVNYINVLSREGAVQLLQELSKKSIELTSEFAEPEDLHFLIEFNQSRES